MVDKDLIQYISTDKQVSIELYDPSGFNAHDMKISFWNRPGIADVVTKREYLKSLRDLINHVLREEELE